MSRRRTPDARTRADQAASTRAALIAAARSLWAERGSFATGTSDIVETAGVGTRGALYHHFADREELFLAVFAEVHAELALDLARFVEGNGDPLDRLRDSLLAFLDLVADRPDAQALLADGPAVFGWRRWRELEEHRGLGAIAARLDEAMAAGVVHPQPAQPLARLLLGLLTDAAVGVSTVPSEREATSTAFANLIDGLRRPPTIVGANEVEP